MVPDEWEGVEQGEKVAESKLKEEKQMEGQKGHECGVLGYQSKAVWVLF